MTRSVADLRDVEEITAGDGHTCALVADKTVRCWGYDDYGILAGNWTTPSLPGLTDVVERRAGRDMTCARVADKTVRCWGLGVATGILHHDPSELIEIPLPFRRYERPAGLLAREGG